MIVKKKKLIQNNLMSQPNLILIRHGQSLWNQKNLFTGWTDIDLSQKGIEEAKQAGLLFKEKQLSFDVAFTSALQRSISTLHYILKELNVKIPIIKAWQLNEKHYGSLQGKNKQTMINKYGEEKIQKWRRDFYTRPPLLPKPQRPNNMELYKNLEKFPIGESLKETQERVISFWRKSILPEIQQNKSVLIVAHGNSLRALIKHLENISDSDVCLLEVQTGQPIIYSIDSKEKILNKRTYNG